MLNKRGQISIFVIIAIVIVAAVLFFLVIQPQITRPALSAEEAQKLLASQIEPIKKYVTDCVEKTYMKCVTLIGYQGGYYKPARFIQFGNYSIPYLVYKEGDNWANDLPLLATIGRNIDECAKSGSNDIKTCINDFKEFKKIIDIEEKPMAISTMEIQECSITIDVDYPLILKRSGSQTSVDKMPFSFSACLGQAYNAAIKITNSETTSQSFDIDTYTRQNPMYILIERQGIPEGIFYYLETIPPTTEIEPYHFHFGVQR